MGCQASRAADEEGNLSRKSVARISRVSTLVLKKAKTSSGFRSSLPKVLPDAPLSSSFVRKTTVNDIKRTNDAQQLEAKYDLYFGEKLGQGSFGSVVVVREKENLENSYAMKMVRLQDLEEIDELRSEIELQVRPRAK